MLIEDLAAAAMHLACGRADVGIRCAIDRVAHEIDKPTFALQQGEQCQRALAVVLRDRDLRLLDHFLDNALDDLGLRFRLRLRHALGQLLGLYLFGEKLRGLRGQRAPEQEPEETEEREPGVHGSRI